MVTSPTRPPISTGLRLGIDIGPLAMFFIVNTFAPGVALSKLLAATIAFMIASGIAMAVSKWKAGHISPMLWISGTLVLVFGGLTLYFHDGTFIKMKPTFVYTMFAAILGYGLLTGKPLLQMLLDAAYPGVDAEGWRKLTRNWAIFFVAMAVLNEYVWRSYAPLPESDTKVWAGFKLWGGVPLTLIFTFANVPMLMRHGLRVAEEPPIAPEE